MGADLYLNGSEDQGYFRDSYNSTCLLWRLGLSWWRDAPKTYNASGEELAEFRKKVAEATFVPLSEKEVKEGKFLGTIDESENSIDKWNTYFLEKREQLLSLLDEAISSGGYVSFSC